MINREDKHELRKKAEEKGKWMEMTRKKRRAYVPFTILPNPRIIERPMGCLVGSGG